MDNNNNISRGEKIYRDPNLEPTMSPVTAAFFGLVAVFFLYQIGGGVLTLLIFGLDVESANIYALRLMTMGGQILLILLPALVFAKLVYFDVSSVIRFRLPDVKILVLFIIGLVILTPLLQSFLNIQNYFLDSLAASSEFFSKLKEIFDSLDKFVERTYEMLLSANSAFEVLFVLVMVSVVPAVCEEVFFRGFVQKSFEMSYKGVWAALLTAVFFGLYHFSPYGLVALIALGFYFGISAYVSNSIVVPITLHFLNNLFAVVIFLIFGNEDFIVSGSNVQNDLNAQVFIFLSLLVVFISFIYFILKYTKNKKGGEHDLSEL